MLWPTFARPARAFAAACLVWACLGTGASFSADLYHDDGLDVRWDNTLRYIAAFRTFSRDQGLLVNPNWDDGDRNFDPGPISNRLDLLSELEVTDGDFGLRLSGAGWYDTVYQQHNDNDSPATFNPFSVRHDEFTRGTRRVHGADIQLGDAFVHGSFEAGGMPLSFRVGRYALLWGESVFFGENSIAAGQAPSDVARELAQPSSYSKDVFLPVWQASSTVQPADDVSLTAYYQFAWRKDQMPGSGSYFSYNDYLDAGGERIFLAPGHFLYRARDITPPDTGQFGLALQVSGSDVNYGLYALRFNAKDPQTYLYFGAPSRGDGLYRLVYPTGTELYGASLSTYLGDSDVSGEMSFRRNAPLVSYPIVVPEGMQANNTNHPLYPIGNSLHGQVSSDTTFGASSLWERADFAVELAANERLAVTRNAENLDPSVDHFAMAFQANFTPQYFEVLPGLDLSIPLGFGYGLVGNSSIDDTQKAHAGNFEIGVDATYRALWKANLTFTHFIGDPVHQRLADRDFVAFTVQRTF
jgi:hypothetical protein